MRLFILLCLLSVAFGGCINGGILTDQALTYCTDYKTESCCTPAVRLWFIFPFLLFFQQDALIESNINAQVVPLLGSDGCTKTLGSLFCAWTCSTSQDEFVQFNNVTGTSYQNWTVYVDSTFAAEFYNTCKDRCFSIPGASETISQSKNNHFHSTVFTLSCKENLIYLQITLYF